VAGVRSSLAKHTPMRMDTGPHISSVVGVASAFAAHVAAVGKSPAISIACKSRATGNSIESWTRALHFQLDPQQPGIDHWVVIAALRPFILPYYFSISCLWCFPLWLSIYRRFVYAFNQSFVGVRWSMGVASSPCHIRQDAAGVKVALWTWMLAPKASCRYRYRYTGVPTSVSFDPPVRCAQLDL